MTPWIPWCNVNVIFVEDLNNWKPFDVSVFLGNVSLCVTLHRLMWFAIRNVLCLYLHHVHQTHSIRFLMVIKQIKKWIKVESSGLWCNIHTVLKHNEPEWFNRDTAYPEVQTNTCLGPVFRGAKVALMSTVVSGLWVTLTQQLNGNETRETGGCTDLPTYTHVHTHSESSVKHELYSNIRKQALLGRLT